MMPDDDRPAGDPMAQLRIVAFEPSHAEAFRLLNLDWIEEFFAVVELDRLHLYAPQTSFIDTGGAILMVVLNGEIVGCCGLLKHADGVYEVSKMAIKRGYRGAGIGKKLLGEVIDYARSLGAGRLEIISSTRLGPAIRLYKQMGFVEMPLESDAYARGNIALVLRLTEPQ